MDIGGALIGEVERVAWEQGIPAFELDASLNALPFYTALRRDPHLLRTGHLMACVRMQKWVHASDQ